MRAPERLICNLQREDARDEAEELGFQFSTSSSEQLLQALSLLRQETEECEEEEVVEEEVVSFEWDEDLGEVQDDLL